MTQLHVFGLTFNLYGLILGVAIFSAYFAAQKYARRIGIEKEMTESLFWWVIGGGIIGARLYHVVDKWQEIYSLDPKSVLFVWNGGLGIWGAIIGGLIALHLRFYISDLRFKYKLSDLYDIVFFGVPLGQAIGRWGNFFNNEIIGKNGEPLFLYESVLNLALFGVLVILVKLDTCLPAGRNSERSGSVAGSYLIGYGLIRIFLEQFRPNEIIWRIAGLPVASIVSFVAVGAGGILIYNSVFSIIKLSSPKNRRK